MKPGPLRKRSVQGTKRLSAEDSCQHCVCLSGSGNFNMAHVDLPATKRAGRQMLRM